MKILARIRGGLAGRVVALAAATVGQTVFGVALIPLATTVLSASDFGLFGLLISISVLAGVVSDGGTALVFPAHYGIASRDERGRMFASFACFAAAIGTVLALVFLTLWPWRHAVVAPEVIGDAPLLAVILTAAMMPLRAVIYVATSMFSVAGRGIAIAIQIALQSAVGFTTTMIGLFVFDLSVSALFLGTFMGQLVTLVASLAILRRSYVTLVPSRAWLAHIVATAPTSGTAGLLDGVRNVLENALLARATGLAAVGFYGHARLYHGLLMGLANTVNHNAWPVALAEARNPAARFEAIRRIWTPVQLGLLIVGLVFAFAGSEIVELISNDKLTPAAAFIAPLIIVALIQCSGKPATAITFASGQGLFAARCRLVASLLGILVIWPVIERFGIAGLVGVFAVEAIVYRFCLYLLAIRVRRPPFQDGIVIAGIAAIALALVYSAYAQPALMERVVILAATITFILLLNQRAIADVFASGRNLLFGSSS